MNKLRVTAFVLGVLTVTSRAGIAQKVESNLSQEDLAGKQFRFLWKLGDTGGFNAVATLRKDGTIAGIASPNETTWLLDSRGRLVFKHKDGRVSTIFDKIERRNGRYFLEGPFQFREGIVHLLEEVGDEVAATAKAGDINQPIRRYSTQQIVCLDLGESYTFRLRSRREKTVRLVSVKASRDSVLGMVRRARVDVQIDGDPLGLDCGPYVMPTEIDGLRIQADTTSDWGRLPKAVQFSLWDSTDPIVDTDRFGFPLQDYRLFSHGMQAYGEVVHLGLRDGDPRGQRFHHNYGIDIAGYEGRETVTSCTDGEVVQLWPTPANASSVVIEDKGGFLWAYAHLDSVSPQVKLGAHIQRGQQIGQLGRKGGSGNFSHIHVGTFLDRRDLDDHRWNVRLNLYPWVVTAHEKKYRAGLYAVAGSHQVAVTGETVVLDGSNSIVFGGKITSYRWELPDGKAVNDSRVETVFQSPGVYVAALRVKDDHGREDVAICRVKVFTKEAVEEMLPTIFMTHTPTTNLAVGQPVRFRLWLQGGGEPMRVDFGDGTVIPDYMSYSEVSHAFNKSGIHLVTAQARVGGKPITQQQKVIVGKGGDAGFGKQ